MLDFIKDNSFIIAQVFGFLAMLVSISMYQFNKHKKVMLLMVLCALLWCCHYTFLGLFTPVAMNFLGAVKNFIFSFKEGRQIESKTIPIIFLILSVVSTLLTWKDAWSVLPLIASVFAIVAQWQINVKHLRLLTIPVCVCWFIYNINNQSWAGTANEVFVLISIIVALIRNKKTETIKVESETE